MLNNKQLPTGPRSEAGKTRSRLNAMRHGLTGQVHVMPQEDRAAFHEFSQTLLGCLAPATPVEQQLAETYVTFQWRINRAAAIEDSLFAMGQMDGLAENYNIDDAEIHSAFSNAKTFRTHAADFDRLSVYSQRLIAQGEKVFKQLSELQKGRKQAQAGGTGRRRFLTLEGDHKPVRYEKTVWGAAAS